MTRPTARRLDQAYPYLGDDGRVTPLELTDSFWTDIGSGAFDHLGSGTLVSTIDFEDDWDVWEIHPAGDELVCLVAGEMEMVLDLSEGERSVVLREPGAFTVVPRGTWHTARVPVPSRAFFLTRGEGTEHKPV